MRVVSSSVLDGLGYRYLFRVFESCEPVYHDLCFRDVVPELGGLDIGGFHLYKHQYLAYSFLRDGFNVILKAGTGSGKTEAWILYVLDRLRNGVKTRVLALYPTLALANDQIKRIVRYASTIGRNVVQIDSVKVEEIKSSVGYSGLRNQVNSADIVISNPAYIHHDVKRMLLKPTSSLLYMFYKELDLLVVDEIDFYNPRSLALLLALIKLLSMTSDKKIQVVVLTATLSNPDDLGVYLKEVTGRDYRVVDGEPFNVENHLYVVLGKDLEKIWSFLKQIGGEVLSKAPSDLREEIVKAIDSYEYFVSNLYRLMMILNGLGVEAPSPSIDLVEIIGSYLKDDYVTIVFTNSISQAEEIVRSVKNRYGEDSPIASHHHLVPKKKRELIEDYARKGLVKVIVSPRTLSQGIDIGTVARIVHVGLPEYVREYYQREGRKGRRRELGFSETVIIPYSRWDRELLSRGYDVFNKWLMLGVEKTLVNPDNLYLHLYTGVAKLVSPWLRLELNDREEKALRATGVLNEKGVDEKLLKRIFQYINFYEYAPPYGVKRYLIRDGEEIPLEPIGHCDLVEKFQPGNIDLGEEAIVSSLKTGRSSRYVMAVYEKPVRGYDFYNDDALSTALEEYRYIKMNWGEKPNILRDILSGRLSSEELCVVYVPWSGFGKYRKIPERCIWKLRSEKPRVRVVRDRAIIYFDRRQIYVPKPTGGEYRDYTYGYLYSVDPGENSDLMRLALASLMIVLRRVYGIGFETIMYDVIKLGEYKYFSLHEPESAGVIDKIDWLDLRRRVEEYSFDDLDQILLSEIDDISYSILISYDFDWNIVKQTMLRIIDYILARDRLKIKLCERELAIPKPSPALKLLSLSIIVEVYEEKDVPHILVSLALYDGDKTIHRSAIYPPIPYIKPPEDIVMLEKTALDKTVYEDYKLIIYDKNKLLEQLKTANLRQLVMLIERLGDRVVDVSKLGREAGLDPFSYEELVESIIPDREKIEPSRIADILVKIGERLEIGKYENDLAKYLETQAKKTYLSYLILEELMHGKGTT